MEQVVLYVVVTLKQLVRLALAMFDLFVAVPLDTLEHGLKLQLLLLLDLCLLAFDRILKLLLQLGAVGFLHLLESLLDLVAFFLALLLGQLLQLVPQVDHLLRELELFAGLLAHDRTLLLLLLLVSGLQGLQTLVGGFLVLLHLLVPCLTEVQELFLVEFLQLLEFLLLRHFDGVFALLLLAHAQFFEFGEGAVGLGEIAFIFTLDAILVEQPQLVLDLFDAVYLFHLDVGLDGLEEGVPRHTVLLGR